MTELRLTSSSFAEGAQIPRQHTLDGPDLSPPLSWTEPPAGTAAFALLVEDPDAPAKTWVHWLVYDIPASSRGLPQDQRRVQHLPDGSRQGRNDYGHVGWGGPKPPPGRPHRYVFRLYALREPLGLSAGADRAAFDTALDGRVLAEAATWGTYAR